MYVNRHGKYLAVFGLFLLLSGAAIAVYLAQRPTSFEQKAAGSNTVKAYTNTPGSVASSNYSMSVNGEPIFVEKYKDISYARFAFNGTVTIAITAKGSISRFTISPKSYGINASQNGNTLSFAIAQPRKLIITINDYERLFIFADPPELNPPQLGSPNVVNVMNYVTDNTGTTIQVSQIQQAIDAVAAKTNGGILYFPNGKYLTGTLTVKSNVHLYLESGALIQGATDSDYYTAEGFIYILSTASNVELSGRGVIDAAGATLHDRGDGGRKSLIKVFNANSISLDGIILRDSNSWTISLDNVGYVRITNIKLINDLNLSNTDGIDPDSATNITIDGVFIYTADDCFAVKTTAGWGLLQPANNILIKNGVCWTKKSALKIGTETKADITNVTFQNNDVVHADRAMSLYESDGHTMDAIKFLSNKSEDIGGDRDQKLIDFSIDERDGKGYIKNVSVSDYTAYQFSPNGSSIEGLDDSHKISNVAFTNLTIEGSVRLNADDARINLDNTENVTFAQGPTATPLPSPTPIVAVTPTTTPRPTHTPTPRPTRTPTPSPTRSPSVTPSVTTTPNPTPTSGVIPTNTPFPTETPPIGHTTLSLSLSLQGVGTASTGANLIPLHPQRTIAVQIFNNSNQQVGNSLSATVTLDQATGLFTGIVDAGNLSSGIYTIKVKTDRYLRKLIFGIQTITKATTNILPQTLLTVGDVNNDNLLDIIDYNLLSACFGSKQQTTSCTTPETADLDDNGIVDGIDYNYLIRNMSIQRGD